MNNPTEVPLTSHENMKARGRNGYFRPVKAEVYRFSPSPRSPEAIEISVKSRQRGGRSPIILQISLDDARRLARTILDQAR